MMVFGPPLRSAEILSIWAQHHGIEQFWRHLKSIVQLSAMSLYGRLGAYASLGVKVLAYILLSMVSMTTGLTHQKIVLFLSGQRDYFWDIMVHFHEVDVKED